MNDKFIETNVQHFRQIHECKSEGETCYVDMVYAFPRDIYQPN